jgi:hypothetical protein
MIVKTIWSATYFIGLAVFVIAGGACAYAQFEVDPDHYETREQESLQQSKTGSPGQVARMHYEGNLTLPYTLQCNKRSLPPGKYSVSLDSDGRTAQVAFNGKGGVLRIQGITRSQNRYRRPDALVAQRNGGLHQLSLILVAKLEVVFDAWLEHQSNDKPRNLERVALILADPLE